MDLHTAMRLLTGDTHGLEEWNLRRRKGETVPDLSGTDLRLPAAKTRSLRGIDLRHAKLTRAQLSNVDLSSADLRGAILIEANLYHATLDGANLAGINLIDAELDTASLRDCVLSGAALQGADLTQANLQRGNLSGANLEGAKLIRTDLSGATLDGCLIYGTAVWDVLLDRETSQRGLVLAPFGRPVLSVDSLEVASFLYLLLFNAKIRHVIDTVTSKVVLILGRFSRERRSFLDSLRDRLRAVDLCPVVFDWEPPITRDLTETVLTLGLLSRFIVADLTDARSVPHELATLIPSLRSVPVVPVIRTGQPSYAMFKDLLSYPWVLRTHECSENDQITVQEFNSLFASAEEGVARIRARTADAG